MKLENEESGSEMDMCRKCGKLRSLKRDIVGEHVKI